MKILNESLTVNNNVKLIASEIKNQLLMRLKNDSIAMSKQFNHILKKGIFTYFTNGKLPIKSFKVKYYVTLYSTKRNYMCAIENSTMNINSECDYENNLIILRLAMLDGNLTRESYGVIEHEVNHFLQNSLGQTKNETLYGKIQTVLENGTNFEKRLAYALYLTFNTEISSFAVQYYSFLKNNNIPLQYVYDDFPVDEGNPYNDFIDNKLIINSKKNQITDIQIKNLFGISKKQYFSRIENADKRYKNKMMKAATKYRDELHEMLFRKINKNTNLSNTIFVKRINFENRCYLNGIITEVSEFD